jgi:hypothetical protein
MRIEIIFAWIFLGFGLLAIGTLFYMFQITEGRFLAVMGIVYFGIGMMLILAHDRHMDKRTRAGRESHR